MINRLTQLSNSYATAWIIRYYKLDDITLAHFVRRYVHTIIRHEASDKQSNSEAHLR